MSRFFTWNSPGKTPGAVAFERLKNLAKQDNLRQAMDRLNSGRREGDTAADITSCGVTGTAVIKTLTNQPIIVGPSAALLSGGKPLVRQGQNNVLTSEIMRHLDENRLVSISMKFNKNGRGGGDHHFVIFAEDKDTIVTAMAWQDKYDLAQWFEENENGKFKRDRFHELMGQIEDGSSNAIVELCAFLGATRDGGSIPELLHREVDGFRAVSEAQSFVLPKT
jgi:hypothetical protein